MPLHPDYVKMKSRMVKKYGKDKGTSVFHAWLKKNSLDETKPRSAGKERTYVTGLFLKELEGEFYTEGFVATDHVDNAHIIPIDQGGTGYPEYIPVSTLYSIADQINNLGSANKASLHHDRSDGKVVGVADNTATVTKMDDGHYGVNITVHNNKTHPEYDNLIYEVQNGMIDGYSIEYEPVKDHIDIREGKEVRVLDEVKVYGYGYASRGINPKASIVDYGYKELVSQVENKEDVKMSKDEIVEKKEEEEAPAEEPAEEEEAPVEETKVDAKEYADFLKFKEMKTKEGRDKEIALMVKEQLKKILPADSPLNVKEDKIEKKEVEISEVKSYKEAVMKGAPIEVQYKAAAALINKDIEISAKEGRSNIIQRSQNAPSVAEKFLAGKERPNWDISYTENGKLSVKEGDSWRQAPQSAYANKLKTKELSMKAFTNTGLETDTNKFASWTYGSYYVLPAELNDIFQPIVINQLNESVSFWNTLQKVDFSNYAAIQFRMRYKRNATAGGQAESYDPYSNSAYTGYQSRAKMTQPFAYYYVFIQVSGPEMALASGAGGIGDVYADEVNMGTVDLINKMETDMISTGEGTSESVFLGLECLCDHSTYTTLYGHTRTTYDAGATENPRYPLRSAGVDDMSSVRITLSKMRTMITACVDNGANQNELAFYCRRLQQDFIRALIQDMQRIVPTSARVGFEGKPELDGVPIFDCINMNTDDLFLIDTAHTKIGVKVAPTYEETAKNLDARNGLIKFYGNLYSDMPSHNYWIYGLATS